MTPVTEHTEFWRMALAPFAEKFSAMAKVLCKFSDAELRYMIESAENATPTNCECHVHDAAVFIKNTCTLELQVRDFNAAVKQDRDPVLPTDLIDTNRLKEFINQNKPV